MDFGTDSEDEVPAGWEERVTADGRVYYANHETRSTQWEHPTTNKTKYISGELPYGWERSVMENGAVIYFDRVNDRSTYTDPRLAFAKIAKTGTQKEKDRMFDVDTNSTAARFLMERDLSNCTAIVTGANRGIGYEITRALASAGCYVIMGCRDVESGEAACNQIKKEKSYANLEVQELDLASFKSVKHFADKFKAKKISLNFLLLNAAVFEPNYTTTENDIELMFQVNHLSHFYLTRLLLESIINTPKSRIIVLSCESHRAANLNRKNICSSKLNVNKFEFDLLQHYCNTKLCNLLFANELHRRLKKLSSDVISCSCHPGNLLQTKLYDKWIPSKLMRLTASFFSKTLAQGAATPIFCGVNKNVEFVGGGIYWNSCCPCPTSNEAQDAVLAYRLWEISEAILINKTQSFDNFLLSGDKFSSITSLSMPNDDGLGDIV